MPNPQGAPLEFQTPPGGTGQPTGSTQQRAYRAPCEKLCEYVNRWFVLLHRGVWMAGADVDKLDGHHGEYYTTEVAGAEVSNPNLVAGSGITITVSGSNVTIAAPNVVTSASTLTADRIVVGAGSKAVAASDVTLAAGGTNMSGVGNLDATGTIKSSGATAGIGYSTGAGGAVTQETSKSTGVELNTVSGEITMSNAELIDGDTVTFTVTNSACAATDLVAIATKSPSGALANYDVRAEAGAGSFIVAVRNVSGGNLSQAVVLSFAVIKAVIA